MSEIVATVENRSEAPRFYTLANNPDNPKEKMLKLLGSAVWRVNPGETKELTDDNTEGMICRD